MDQLVPRQMGDATVRFYFIASANPHPLTCKLLSLQALSLFLIRLVRQARMLNEKRKFGVR